MRFPAIIATGLVGWLAACNTVPAQLVVVIDSDYAPAELSCIELTVTGASASAPATIDVEVVEGSPAPGQVALPFSFGVLPPRSDTQRSVRVEVAGIARRAGEDTCPARGSPAAIERRLVVRTAQTGFRAGTRLRLPLFLSRVCEPLLAECEARGETCAARCDGRACAGAECVPVEVATDTLETVTPGDELTPDAGTPDASSATPCEEWDRVVSANPNAAGVDPVSIVATSTSLFVAWKATDSPRVHVARTSFDGVPLCPEVLNTYVAPELPVLVPQDGAALLAYADSSDTIVLQPLTAKGDAAGAASFHDGLTQMGPFDVAWSGARVGVAWIDYRVPPTSGDIYFSSVALPTTGAAHTPMAAGYSNTQIVWTGGEFITLGLGAVEVVAGSFNEEGMPTDPGTTVFSSMVEERFLAFSAEWDGANVATAILASSMSAHSIEFALITPALALASPVVTVATGVDDASAPSLAWTGERHGIAWTQGSALWFAVVGQDGTMLTPPRSVPVAGPPSSPPTLAAGNGGWYAAYAAGTGDVHVARLCP